MTQKFQTPVAEPYRELADKIAAGFKIEGATIAETAPHAAYNENLPDGITAATIKTVAKYNNSFIQASRLAVAEASAEMFSASPKIDTVNAELGFFAPGDSLRLRVERERTYVNPQAGEGQPNTLSKQLVIGMTVNHRGQSGKALRDALSTEYAEQFKR